MAPRRCRNSGCTLAPICAIPVGGPRHCARRPDAATPLRVTGAAWGRIERAAGGWDATDGKGRAMQFGRYYEEFEVGATYLHWPGKTVTEDDDGVVYVETKGCNQDGRLVCVFRRKVMVPKRSYGDTRGGEQPAVLIAALGLDVHHAAVVLGLRLGLVQHRRLPVDGVAVEGRRDVAQRLDLEVGQGLAGDVRHRHAQQQRVDVVADHDIALE